MRLKIIFTFFRYVVSASLGKFFNGFSCVPFPFGNLLVGKKGIFIRRTGKCFHQRERTKSSKIKMSRFMLNNYSIFETKILNILLTERRHKAKNHKCEVR